MSEVPDIETVIASPLAANVYKLNPSCGRCGAPATCAMASIGEMQDLVISLLTVCAPCAEKITATLDKTHAKIGTTWIRADAADFVEKPDDSPDDGEPVTH